MIERVRRWRWPLVIVLFGLCVLLRLNGSSVAFWTKILHEPETQSGVLLFSPKLVRSIGKGEFCHACESILALVPFWIDARSTLELVAH